MQPIKFKFRDYDNWHESWSGNWCNNRFVDAIKNDQLDAVKQHVENGRCSPVKFFCNLDFRTVYDLSPIALSAIHYAVYASSLNVIKFLISRGISPNLKLLFFSNGKNIAYRNMETPLYFAVSNGSLAAIEYLLDAGANPNIRAEGLNLLHVAIKWDGSNLGKIEFLMDEVGFYVNETSDDGETPLMLAAEYASFDLLDFLLKRGADWSARDLEGRTVLNHGLENDTCPWTVIEILLKHVESSRGKCKMTEFLNFQDQQGDTILHWICYDHWRWRIYDDFRGWKFIEEYAIGFAQFLLQQGASLHVQNKDGTSVRELIRRAHWLHWLKRIQQKKRDLGVRG